MITIDPAKKAAKAATEAKAALREFDLASIRGLREYIAKQADAPIELKTIEASVIGERKKIK